MFPARLRPGLPSPASFLRLRLQAQLFLLTLSYASLACPDVLSSGHLRPCSSLPCSRLLVFRGPSVFVSRHPRSFYHIASSPTPPLLLEHGPSLRGHCSHCYLHCRRAGQWPVSGGTPPSLPLVPCHPNCQVRRTQAPAPQPSSGHSCPQGGSLPPTLSLGGRACGAASQCSPAWWVQCWGSVSGCVRLPCAWGLVPSLAAWVTCTNPCLAVSQLVRTWVEEE